MQPPSDNSRDWDAMRERIIGMGESSIHKSYYPLLQQRLADLERFRSLIDETNDLILVIQAGDAPAVDANRACSNLLGYPMDTIRTMPVEALVAFGERDRFWSLISSAAASRTQEKTELNLISADGQQYPVELSIRFVTFDENDYGVIIAHDIRDRKMYERALLRAQKKLNLINFFTRNEIQSQVFIVRAYLDVLKQIAKHPEEATILGKLSSTITEIQRHISFAENYRDVGAQEPLWQNFSEVVLLALSHLPPVTHSRAPDLKKYEILSDTLLEKGLVHLIEYLYLHGSITAEITITHSASAEGLLLTLEKEGTGIPESEKENVFSWENSIDKTHSLFFIREVLDITAISIREAGDPGHLRFEILAPAGTFRTATERESPG
ncbi:PAS domain S-box protein [Methanoregula sp.]|uniref:PAS domain S-box protein n=1 Tax=Methanoregula sp. TaxID=2052170 RepID=UPI003568477C